MKRFKDSKTLEQLGQRIRAYRKHAGFSIENIAEMTGFAARTIRNAEAGEESSVSYIVEICKAIGLHPRDAFDFKIAIKPRFKLSEASRNKPQITRYINTLIEKNYFKQERTTKDVAEELAAVYSTPTKPANLSSILIRKVAEKELRSEKRENKNYYKQ